MTLRIFSQIRDPLSPSRIQLIHDTLLESPEFSFKLCPTLNPAILIPSSSEPPIHTCKEALGDLMPHVSHIFSTPLNNPDFTWYIDGNSSMTSEGEKVAGCAIVSDTEIIESQPLPLGTSSQKAVLIALARALTLAANERANGHRGQQTRDSKCAFHIIHLYAAIWKERGLLSAKSSPITNALLILQLLKAANMPTEVGIMLPRSPGGLRPHFMGQQHRRHRSKTSLTPSPAQ